MDPVPRVQLQRRSPLVWLILLLVADILLPGKIWSMLLVGFGGLFLVAYLWVRLLKRGLRGSRQLRFGWVAVGDRLSEQFEIYNNSDLPALWVELVDESNVPGYQVAVVRSVGARSDDRWRQAAICQQRGQYRLGPWSLQSADPFGIFRVTITYPKTEEIVIHPPVHAQIPINLPAGQSSGRARSREMRWQATINAATVRNYQPRDPLQWIHWPTTARRDELFVRQFDLDAAGDVWLVLDLQAAVQLGQGIESTEEHSVLLAASLAAQALAHNRAIGLASYGRQPQLIPPRHGKQQQWRLLRALALVEADGQNDLARALRDVGQVAQRGSAALIITPSDQADWIPELLHLVNRGVHSNVVLLDRASFTGTAGGNSQALRQMIRQLGFETYLIRQGETGIPVEDQGQRGFWEFKVTASGRVVTVRNPLQA